MPFPFFSVPPTIPTIYDETGREIKDLVGPYLEGETIVLKCITSGGKKRGHFFRLFFFVKIGFISIVFKRTDFID